MYTFWFTIFTCLVLFVKHFTMWNIILGIMKYWYGEYIFITVNTLFVLSCQIMFIFSLSLNTKLRNDFYQKNFSFVSYPIFVIFDFILHTFPFLYYVYIFDKNTPISMDDCLVALCIILLYIVLSLHGVRTKKNYKVDFLIPRVVFNGCIVPIVMTYLLNSYGRKITLMSAFIYMYHAKDYLSIADHRSDADRGPADHRSDHRSDADRRPVDQRSNAGRGPAVRQSLERRSDRQSDAGPGPADRRLDADFERHSDLIRQSYVNQWSGCSRKVGQKRL